MSVHPYNGGGDSTVVVTQAQIVAGNVVVRGAPNRLVTVLNGGAAATAGAALTFFDNASAASGTVIGVVPIGLAAGGMITFNMPAAAGIVVGQQAAFTGGPLTIATY